MTRASLSALLAACTLGAAGLGAPAAAADVDVGVSVQISQPGVYGRIDIGRFPHPQVIVSQPVLVHQPPAARHGPVVRPVYLWVPPGHRKNWRRHCRAYGACGVPVYFVRQDWYERELRRDRGHDHGPGRGRGKHD